MPKRCGDVQCGNLVNEKKAHVSIGNLVFCKAEHAQNWLIQNKIFEVAADPFHEPMTRRSETHRSDG